MIGLMTSSDDGRVIEVNGISLYVEEHGDGAPVLLLHGWPDSARLWRHQIPVLAASGYRVITPDMRGFGRSERPAEVRSYGLRNVVGDVSALLDGLGVQAAHVVGHDWGAAVAWLTAILHPDRVPHADRDLGAAPARAAHCAAVRNGLVSALLPVLWRCGGDHPA